MQRFSALILSIKEPKTTALIFSTGKVVCTGSKNEAEALTAARKIAKKIKKLGFKVKFINDNFVIQNIVASANVNFRIRLQEFCDAHDQFASVYK